jgi:hypothetical protein
MLFSLGRSGKGADEGIVRWRFMGGGCLLWSGLVSFFLVSMLSTEIG